MSRKVMRLLVVALVVVGLVAPVAVANAAAPRVATDPDGTCAAMFAASGFALPTTMTGFGPGVLSVTIDGVYTPGVDILLPDDGDGFSPTGAVTYTGTAATDMVWVDNDTIGPAGTNVRLGDDADFFCGSVVRDVVWGGSGTDFIYLGPGPDKAYGGAGADVIVGGAGADALRGNEGNDWLFGGPDNDRLWGKAGNDYVAGNEGADIVRGDDGGDYVLGGGGRFMAFNVALPIAPALGFAGAPGIVASLGDGLVATGPSCVFGPASILPVCLDGDHAWDGNDRIFGGAGVDLMAGGGGSDEMYGGADADCMTGGLFLPLVGPPIVDGNGNPLPNYAIGGPCWAYGVHDGNPGPNALPTLPAWQWPPTGFGGGAPLAWSDTEDFMSGGAGNDDIYGDGGDDEMWGRAGNDDLWGGADDDIMSCGFTPGDPAGFDTVDSNVRAGLVWPADAQGTSPAFPPAVGPFGPGGGGGPGSQNWGANDVSTDQCEYSWANITL